jgi:hypothetical protein
MDAKPLAQPQGSVLDEMAQQKGAGRTAHASIPFAWEEGSFLFALWPIGSKPTRSANRWIS